MAIEHAAPGDLIDVRPLGAGLRESDSRTLIRTTHLEVFRYALPAGKTSDYRISAKELQMAEQLIDSMSGTWTPGDYRDEFRERLHAIIRKRVKGKVGTAKIEDEAQPPEEAATNVVDFMALLKQSLDAKKRTPAKKTAAKRTRAAKKAPAKKAPAKKAAKKAAPRRKAG